MTDYISREAAIEQFRKSLDGGYVLTDEAQTTHILQSIPAADVVPVGAYNQVAWERDTAIEQLKQIGKSFGEQMNDVRPVRHGRWSFDNIMFTDADGVSRSGMWGYKCSECDGFCIGESNFCPNCGADMRGESQPSFGFSEDGKEQT